MKLVQQRFLQGTSSFEIFERHVHIRVKRQMAESEFDVPFENISPSPSYHRSAPVQWLIFAIIFGAVALFTLYGMVHDSWVPDKSGFVGTFLIFLVASLGCGLIFYQRKVDWVILRSAQSGAAIIFLHRSIPSEVHVKEFIDILRERIEAAQTSQ